MEEEQHVVTTGESGMVVFDGDQWVPVEHFI